MKIFRYSPIQSEKELNDAIAYTHVACHKLLKLSLGLYLPVCGNIGIFCHSDTEHEFLIKILERLTDTSQSILKKYFRLYTPIRIPAKDNIPTALYTHLYIRKPDDHHPQVGDVDFYLAPDAYKKLKQELLNGKIYPFARIFPRGDLDMIEILKSDVDGAVYIRSDEELTERGTTRDLA